MTALTLVIPSRSTAVRALKAYPGISHGMLTANAGDGVGGTAKAAGRVKELQVRDDGIYGRVAWTAAASASIKAEEYRYLSPVIPHRKADGRVLMILSAALTNTPALDLEAAAASAVFSHLSEEGTEMEKILTALGLPKGSGEDAVPFRPQRPAHVQLSAGQGSGPHRGCQIDGGGCCSQLSDVRSRQDREGRRSEGNGYHRRDRRHRFGRTVGGQSRSDEVGASRCSLLSCASAPCPTASRCMSSTIQARPISA